MGNEQKFAGLPLRQRKYARTKLALRDAGLAALESRTLEEVPVRELCAAAEISEASFFNYFRRKADLLVYHVQLWSLEMGWHAARPAGPGGLASIEEVFERTGRQVAARPGVMAEIIAGQVRMTSAPALGEVTEAERLLAFPELDGIEEVEAAGLDAVLPPLLERAVAAGELPAGTDLTAARHALASIFFGAPVVFRWRGASAVAAAYRSQLRLLWSGLRAAPRSSPR
jgi:AcrR family transcriptional regulator